MESKFLRFDFETSKKDKVEMIVCSDPVLRGSGKYDLLIKEVKFDGKVYIENKFKYMHKTKKDGKTLYYITIYKKDDEELLNYLGIKKSEINLGITNKKFNDWYENFIIKCEELKKADKQKKELEFDSKLNDESIIKLTYRTNAQLYIEHSHESKILNSLVNWMNLNSDIISFSANYLNEFKTGYNMFDYGYETYYEVQLKVLNELCLKIQDKNGELQKETERKAKIEEERKAKKEEWTKTFSIVKEIKLIRPTGGEYGEDGYYHLIIKNNNTEKTYEVVLRNVFDVGCWTDIKGKKTEDRTDDEKLACKWVYDHPPFSTHIRM